MQDCGSFRSAFHQMNLFYTEEHNAKYYHNKVYDVVSAIFLHDFQEMSLFVCRT